MSGEQIRLRVVARRQERRLTRSYRLGKNTYRRALSNPMEIGISTVASIVVRGYT